MEFIKKNKFIKVILIIIIVGFALIGVVFSFVFLAMKMHWTDVRGSIDSRNQYFNNTKDENLRSSDMKGINNSWKNSTEFETFKNGIIKDKDIIDRVSRETSVPGRLIVSSVISEQLRFFTSNRESFKKYFEPLKILGNYSQFSYGVSGIKMETAKQIEENLKDKNSPFYLGSKYENIIDYISTEDLDSQRIARFTNSHDHYYSYLYTALYLKQIMSQWERALYPISNRPEVLATLFNLGFDKSIPKENPEVGGSTIVINDHDYTFGGLAYMFYYSEELRELFPFEVQ